MASDWRVVDEPLARVCAPRAAWCGATDGQHGRVVLCVRVRVCTRTRPVTLASRRGRTNTRDGSRRRPGAVPVVCWTSAAGTVRCCAPCVPTGLTRSCWAAIHRAESIAQGFGDGLRLWTGTASNLPGDVSADLVIAVNVIEHTIDPIAFLTALRAALQPDGLLVIVCPDGGRPGLDLLFVDHVFSFSREHLGTLLSRAGLQRLGASQAPRSLGAFQMAIGRRRDATQTKAIPAPAAS